VAVEVKHLAFLTDDELSD